MILKADFRCKQVTPEADDCVVEKVVELPTVEYDRFCRSMLERYPFIGEVAASLHYNDGMRHGFLVLGVGRNDGILVDPQGADYARYSAFIPNARSLLTPDMAIDRSYISPAEPWRDESRDEMLRMTLHVDGKPDYTLVLPADEKYLDAVKAYLDIDVFADAMLRDIRFKVPYIGELICDTDCPSVEDYNEFAEALEGIWQKDGMPDTPGLAVWKAGHIGVYIGNGEVIEAMGTKYGVVKTQLEGRGWTHWLEVPGIEYE